MRNNCDRRRPTIQPASACEWNCRVTAAQETCGEYAGPLRTWERRRRRGLLRKVRSEGLALDRPSPRARACTATPRLGLLLEPQRQRSTTPRRAVCWPAVLRCGDESHLWQHPRTRLGLCFYAAAVPGCACSCVPLLANTRLNEHPIHDAS